MAADEEGTGGSPSTSLRRRIAQRRSDPRFLQARRRLGAYNDACSLSGYYSLLNKLAQSGTEESFFDSVQCSGSHLTSIEAVLSGEVDTAAIDSNVLRIRLREAPALRKELHVIESWGSYPIQPVVVDSIPHPELKQRLRARPTSPPSPTHHGNRRLPAPTGA